MRGKIWFEGVAFGALVLIAGAPASFPRSALTDRKNPVHCNGSLCCYSH